jgi:hypothetical protein
MKYFLTFSVYNIDDYRIKVARWIGLEGKSEVPLNLLD